MGGGVGWSEEALDLARDARHDRGRSDEIERDGGELHEAAGEGALLVAEQQDLVEGEVVERRLVTGRIRLRFKVGIRVRIRVTRARSRARVWGQGEGEGEGEGRLRAAEGAGGPRAAEDALRCAGRGEVGRVEAEDDLEGGWR